MKLGQLIIEVANAPLVDDPRHGGKRRDWTTATWLPVGGCAVQAISGQETTEGREFTADHVRLFAPFEAREQIQATSRVRILATIYDVDGDPAVWHDPSGRGHHIEAVLKLSKG